jgi:hypothetical protein
MVNRHPSKWTVSDAVALETLRPLDGPYVAWTAWSLRPSALVTVLNEVDVYERTHIVECGCGVSTILLARLLKARFGAEAHLVSLENDSSWAAYLRSRLVAEELATVAQIVDAPLVPWLTGADSTPWDNPEQWYDPDVVTGAISNHIDLLLVDGPAAGLEPNRLVRYPALPLLRESLTSRAVVFLDDADRPAEFETARRWTTEFDMAFQVIERLGVAVARLDGRRTLTV